MSSFGPCTTPPSTITLTHTEALRKIIVRKAPGSGVAGGGNLPQAGVSGRGCQGVCVRTRVGACVGVRVAIPPGVHAHDGAQQLAALDGMVSALLPLPPRRRLLHDPALLCQGICGFKRGSDVRSKAFNLMGEPEMAVVSP